MGTKIPAGFKAIGDDWRCYRQVAGARSAADQLRLFFTASSFWSLAVYRVGRVARGDAPAWARLVAKGVHWMLFPVVQHLSKVRIEPSAELGKDIWLGSHHTLIIAPGSRIGAGVRLHGGNTLGIGGRPGARGVPTLQAGVELAQGAVVVGPVEVVAGVVVGPNSVVSKSVLEPGAWAGVPVRRLEGPAERLRPHSGEMKMQNEIVKPEPFFAPLREDVGRFFIYHDRLSWSAKARICLSVDSIWAMAAYRLGRALKTRRLPRLARPLWWGYRALETAVRIVTGIHLHPDSQIGSGFYIGHFGPIFVGPGVRIGKNSSIGQMCVVSAGGPEGQLGSPELGERVYLGVGSKIIGGVRVGCGAAVGANAVVLNDVPANAVVVGNPGEVISYRGSADFIYLGKAPRVPVAEQPGLSGLR